MRRKRVLLDECVPHDLRHALRDFDVETALFAGLNGISNGKLLAAAERRFDVLVTLDRHMLQQQSLANRRLSVVVIEARSTVLSGLLPVVDDLRRAIADASPGQLAVVAVRDVEDR